MHWVLILFLLVFCGLLAYWLLVLTEGVFLGQRVVVWLYDLTAGRYDAIKEFNREDEHFLVTTPVLARLRGLDKPLLLDVATGTGRVPFDLMQSDAFTGRVIGLDASRPMLEIAAAKLETQLDTGRIMLVQAPAGQLPFPQNRFDAVTCLEALEFFPSDAIALQEMARVLKPGGFLLTTRRKGREGRRFLHRYRPEAKFVSLLNEMGFQDVRTYSWEVGYDLAAARLPQIIVTPAVVLQDAA